jgi:hypothetical protein
MEHADMNSPRVTTAGKKAGPTLLRVLDVIDLVGKARPALLDTVPRKRAVTLIQAAFDQLGKYIDVMPEGVVRVQGFGNFRVRLVEQEKDGARVTVKRTIFRAAKGISMRKQNADV